MVVALFVLLGVVAVLLVVARNHSQGMTVFKDRDSNSTVHNRIWKNVKTAICGFNSYRRYISVTPAEYGFEYTQHRFESELLVELSGWYIKTPDEEGLVVLFNWFGGCKSDNLIAAEGFTREGYSVFLVDLRGHGDSSGNKTYFGFREYRDVMASVDYARYTFNPEKLVVYGVSLGAVAAMRAFYMAEMRVDALILEAPFDRLINTIKHRVAVFGVPAWVGHILAVVGGYLQKYNPYSFNPVDYAREIDIPVLIIHGEADPFVMVWEVESIFNNLKGNNKSELYFAAAHGHGTVMGGEDFDFKKVIAGFLQKI